MAAAVLLAAAAAHADEPAFGSEEFRPTPRRPVGFRGDWTGRYPGAQPPLEWSIAKSALWRAPVGAGEAPPIVVGDRVFIVADSIRLSCLRRSDGKLLWQRRRHLDANVPAEKEVARLEQYVDLYHRVRPVRAQRQATEQALKRLDGAARPGREDATQAAALRQTLDALDANLAPLEARLKDVAGAADFLRVSNCSGQVVKNPQPHIAAGPFARAIATPCSDGSAVYAWMCTGVLAAYDLDGKPLWRRVLGDRRACGGWYGGQVAPSPALVDGKLVVHYDRIYCLDAATGRTLWETPQKLMPIPSPIPGRKNGHHYIALGPGQILRLSDGKYIEEDEVGPNHDHVGVGSPIFYDGVFCWMSHALELPDDPNGRPRVLWQLTREALENLTKFNHVSHSGDESFRLRGMGWHAYASPVRDGDLVYYHWENGVFSAIEARTGKWVFSHSLVGPGREQARGSVYPSLTKAGAHVFATGSGGVTLAIKPPVARGGEPAVAGQGRATGDLGGNALVFHGRQVFIHAGEELICIGEK
jgi:hypothetical protein